MPRFFIIAIVFGPTLARAIYASKTVQAISGQGFSAFFEVFRNDAPLLGLVLGLLTLTATIRNYWLACLPFLGATTVQLVLISDIVVYKQFSLRLTWPDVVKFYDYSVKYILDLNMVLLAGFLLFIIVFLALAYLVFRTVRAFDLSLKKAAMLLASIAIVSTVGWQSRNVAYVHYRFYQNVVSYNEVIVSESREYSDDFVTSVVGPPQETCTAHPVVSGPVIIYMVESLSSYQTKFFGGFNDWMPRLDEIAEGNAALTDFYANGFTTEDGELSLLTAEAALYRVKSKNVFIALSNDVGAVSRMDPDDRRFVPYISDSGPLNRVFTAADHAVLDTPDEIGRVRHLLETRNISAFNPHVAPQDTSGVTAALDCSRHVHCFAGGLRIVPKWRVC